MTSSRSFLRAVAGADRRGEQAAHEREDLLGACLLRIGKPGEHCPVEEHREEAGDCLKVDAQIRSGTYYRCTARTLAPGAAALADHPATVNLREDTVLDSVNGWIGGLFTRENVDQTVAALAASQGGVGGVSGAREALKARLAKADARLRRLRAAVEAGADPAALIEGLNEAHAERVAARAELENAPVPDLLSDAEIFAMIDSLGDVRATLADARPASLSRLYQQLRLQLRYQPDERAVYVTAQPRVDSARVRGPSCAQPLQHLHGRLPLCAPMSAVCLTDLADRWSATAKCLDRRMSALAGGVELGGGFAADEPVIRLWVGIALVRYLSAGSWTVRDG